VKGLHTSTLVFNIVQFFSSLNYYLLSMILTKVGFDSNIFFSNYLINRKTQYIWSNFIPLFFNADVGIRQGFALSSILSILYIALIFHILGEKIFLINQIQIFFVVIILFLLSSNNSDFSLNMISLRFFIFLDWQRTLTLLL